MKSTAPLCDKVIALGNAEQISPVLKLAFRFISNIIDSLSFDIILKIKMTSLPVSSLNCNC